MKSTISLPLISFLTLTSTVTAAPQSTPIPTPSPTPTPTTLTPQQISLIRSYALAQETKPAYISVSRILKTGIPAATLSKQQADFRLAALTTRAPKLPAYLGNVNDEASSYLQDYYLAQASIINQEARKDDGSGEGANLLDGITGTATAVVSTTDSGDSSKPSSTKSEEDKPTTSSGATASQTTQKPESTNTKDAVSSGTGTVSSGSSTGAAVVAQPTGVMRMAGVGVLGVAGLAAFL